ncbi:1-deoxy-D-xylulose-5-phosphate synthase [Shewanella waksmanii]|uniref:1-deoxy-D-xylulose-5-phosphate synthase n=1 Tax=Shewanella waksmanii TaxID=213783 RepID=UPI00048E9157|nr:1-deoxy-D-xylulose-5-phosphate synthase [Shewanella waksmanii]
MNKLSTITKPQDIKAYNTDQLSELADEIRAFLIDSISQTGGHIGANLGVIELTLALHYVFDFGTQSQKGGDSILFDVGHQGYTHKLITGRLADFSSLNTPQGMSRFISNHESDYDLMEASHAGTSIPIATGMAYSKLQSNDEGQVVAFIGDGSMVEGMAFEGLNFGAEHPIPLVIVINDNGMSIPKNLGAIHKLFSSPDWSTKCALWFKAIGYDYIAVPNGHNMEELIDKLSNAKLKAESNAIPKPTVIHVKTQKGKGLALADEHPYKMHFSMPFNPVTGAGVASTLTGQTYQGIVGDVLEKHMAQASDIFALTPATPYASGIEALMKAYPTQAIDVGMAEQHAVGMAVGLAMESKRVFLCFQSTFMQRAIDQIFHDVCYPQHPITIVSARSGFAGFDGPTHHGIYDFGLLRALPNIQIFYAGTARDLEAIISARASQPHGPMIILHPYETVPLEETNFLPSKSTPLNQDEIIIEGKDGLIITIGNHISTALAVRDKLLNQKGLSYTVLNLRWIKPLAQSSLVPLLTKHKHVVTIEESQKDGGIGVAINQLLTDNNIDAKLCVNALEQGFFPAGDKESLCAVGKIDSQSVYQNIIANRSMG